MNALIPLQALLCTLLDRDKIAPICPPPIARFAWVDLRRLNLTKHITLQIVGLQCRTIVVRSCCTRLIMINPLQVSVQQECEA